MKRLCLLAAVAITALHPVVAQVRMPKFFSDNMVIQRDIPIRIWGHAAKNEIVTVRFNAVERSAVADCSGRWEITLDAMAYGGPYELLVTGENNEIRFGNVLIGDVWLCSGQSNMEWALDLTTGCEEEIEASANPKMRLLTVEKVVRYEEEEDIKGGSWVECTPETARYFSAVGYYFGKFLQKDLDVPIGLINSSMGGTNIQSWTSWEMMQTTDAYKQYAGRTISQSVGFNPKNVELYEAALQREPGDRERWYDPAVNARVKGWKKMYVPKYWEGALADDDGVVWFRTTVVLPAAAAAKTGILHLPAVDDSDDTYINGRLVGKTWSYNEPRNYEIPAGVLHAGNNLLVVKITDVQGGGGIWGDPAALYLDVDGIRYELAGEWEYKPSVVTSQYGVANIGANSFAALLYNGMIRPLVGYGIRGVIWYQGENNTYEAKTYHTLFPNLIKDWRKQWGYDFPFLWVQLANYMAVEQRPMESEWAELREAQNTTLSVPHTGQAVITDIGETDDIHPRNKRDVGYRLYLNALKVAYNRDIVNSGPVYKSMEKQGCRIMLCFDVADGGLRPVDDNRYGYLRGFTIAGADRKFVYANAYVLDSNHVVVFSDDVPEPVAVRYGWANNPYDDDLTNESGLLASPFRTDDWPGITR